MSEFYGTKRVAELTGYSQSQVSKLCREGKFPTAEQDAKGCPWRIAKDDSYLLNLIENNMGDDYEE